MMITVCPPKFVQIDLNHGDSINININIEYVGTH